MYPLGLCPLLNVITCVSAADLQIKWPRICLAPPFAPQSLQLHPTNLRKARLVRFCFQYVTNASILWLKLFQSIFGSDVILSLVCLPFRHSCCEYSHSIHIVNSTYFPSRFLFYGSDLITSSFHLSHSINLTHGSRFIFQAGTKSP